MRLAIKAGIIIATFAFFVEAVYPDMEDPPGLHIPLLIGYGIAFLVDNLFLRKP